jgi:hypothetical protein
MKNIFQSILAIMNDISAIGKDKQNVQQGFKFRGIDDVYNALHPLMAKHGVFSVPQVTSKESSKEVSANGKNLFYEKLMITYTFCAEDGSNVQCTVLGVGMDSGDKAANKAMAIAHKYALLQIFCVPTVENDDPDKESYEIRPQPMPKPHTKPMDQSSAPTMSVITPAQLKRLKTIASESGRPVEDIKAIIAACGYNSSKDIKPADYDKICNAITNAPQPEEPPLPWETEQPHQLGD